MVDLICEWCGQTFVRKQRTQKGGKLKRFCSKSCSAQWRMSRPEYVATLNTEKRRQASSETLKRVRTRPDVQAKLQQHLSGPNNPFKNPQTNRKAQIALREKTGYRHLNGGNGRGLTVPQRLLAERLGWPTEYVISLGARRSGYPSHYKIDVAEPLLMVAIEIDGEGHKARIIAQADQRKTAFLESVGWTVLRFSNQEILENLNRVVDSVLSTILKPELAITSPTGC